MRHYVQPITRHTLDKRHLFSGIFTKPGTGTGTGVSFMVSQSHTEPAGLSDPLLSMYNTGRFWSREVIVRDES